MESETAVYVLILVAVSLALNVACLVMLSIAQTLIRDYRKIAHDSLDGWRRSLDREGERLMKEAPDGE